MFGYIQPLIPELKVKDKELYRAYYCGLCRSLGKYGGTCRAALTYDAVFAALLLTAALPGPCPEFKNKACIMHPASGRMPYAARTEIFDFCAAVGVMLARYKLMDDSHDGRPMRRCLIPVFAGGAKKAAKAYPEAAEIIRRGMEGLAGLEKKREADTDGAPVMFGEMLAALICSCRGVTDELRPLLESLCRAIGGFVYVADAWDDRAEDKKRGCYNIFNIMEERLAAAATEKAPEAQAEAESAPQASEPESALGETASAMIDMYINSAVLAYDLMDLKYCKPVLDNIIYLGLRAAADRVLNGKEGDE